MAFIRYVEESEASSELRAMYDRYREPAGHVDNILKVHGLNPPSLEGHVRLYQTLMRGRSELSRSQREMIAVLVSSMNACHYWLHHHAAGLARLTKDEALADAIATDYHTAGINDAERTMLDYAAKLTKTPASVAGEDVEGLRAAGFSDAAILDICQVTAYFAFVNRIADGLGIELES